MVISSIDEVDQDAAACGKRPEIASGSRLALLWDKIGGELKSTS
jgi:hypothetical protein